MELPFTTTTVSDLQKAWHIFSLLLSTGRPHQPPELSSKCTLFHSSPELIEFLCFIPNSPLHLTSNYLVTFSQIGFVATFNFFANANAVYPAFVPQLEQRRDTECMTGPYYRKRKRITRSEVENSPLVKRRGVFNNFDGEEGSEVVLTLPSINQRNYAQAYLPKSNLSCGMNHLTRISLTLACDLNGFYEMFKTPWKVGLSTRPSSSGLKSIEYECENKIDRGESNSEANTVHIPICKSDIFRQSVFNSAQLMPLYTSSLETLSASNAAEMVDTTEKKVNSDTNSCTKEDNEMKIQLPEADTLVHGFENMIHKENFVEGNEDPTSSHVSNRNINYTKAHPALVYKSPGGIPRKKNIGAILANMQLHRKLPGKSAPTSKPFQREVLDQGEQNINKALKNHNAASLLIREHLFRDPKLIPTKQKNKQKFDLGISFKERKGNPKENGENFACNSTNESSEQKKLPNFESYIMEEEEGSGGYGTVYRARRKSDEVKFAIKCPHANANKQHVHNELKMLERFGGKNFVIKYEGSFKDGDSDCLVLEHVEHDRPEILKRDIDVYQLQWYGYCMFRALAGLHKQGIVHRDVKPGNFLFSRKVNKGYLIDFNLALDLHQKYGTSDKTKVSNATSFNNSLPKSLPPIKQRKYSTAKLEEGINEEASKGTKPLLRLKNLKRKADQEKVGTSIAYRSIIKSQGADGSGITSTKDATSNRTPSAERLREPVPCQGRKELINLVQEALNGSSPGEINGPTSKRKRVAATPGKAESKYFYVTPMPLHSSGIGIGGAGLLKSKGEGKHKREGPCVGTKGFRAPEVLFRSLHQGPKLDIWSAGVTLLYFIIGRTPFAGDPDQNIKEIAKLRGTEDLWEVAKLNNRESSFPPDLFDVKFLSSVKLRDWCRQNSKKPGFLEVMPQSLVDLVDKCLTVNPRLRISAEEALRHEFFAPCHEALRKHRLYRQGLNQGSQETGSTLPLPKRSQTCEVL